jgi:hypothetical protein
MVILEIIFRKITGKVYNKSKVLYIYNQTFNT